MLLQEFELFFGHMEGRRRRAADGGGGRTDRRGSRNSYLDFIILWILMRKPHLKRSLPPILTPPQNLELPLFTNKQTIFLNFDTCKSFVVRYLVGDDDMEKNHYPKH